VKARPVIVTRPGAPGAQLTRDLQAAGLPALWLPAFTLGPPPDPAHVDAVLAHLSSYQLAIFISVPAVEATAHYLHAPWPASTAIGVVGAGTRRAVLEHIASAAGATWFVPDKAAEGEGGSEALWQVLSPALGGLRRALILRAQHGREWLGAQLAAAGVEVEPLAVYVRQAAQLDPSEAAQVRKWQADYRLPVLVITSSEAVDAVVAQLDRIESRGLLRSARVVAPHERIVARARDAGFADVRFVPLEVEAIRQAAVAQ
jgi:uroporphyrinogen-III synthase